MAEILLMAGVLLLVFVLTVFILLIYSGLFQPIDIGTGKPPIGKSIIAYKYAVGPYRDAARLFGDVSRVGPSIKKCIGIYYDDPQTVDSKKCRCAVGAILAEDNQKVDEEIKKNFVDDGFKVFTIPAVTTSVKTSFPCRTALSMYIAIFRVYPKLTKYVKDKGLSAYPYLETNDGKKMEFAAPLVQNDDFFVDETRAEK